MIGELLFENGFLTSCALYGTICISAGLIVSLLLRRSAARAHQALLLAMVAAVLVPVMSTLVRHYELGIFSARGASAPALATESTIMPGLIRPVVPAFTSPDLEYYAGVTEEYYPAATAVAPAPAAAPFPWRIALLALWLGVGVILLVRLIVTFILGRRLLGKAAPVTSQAIRLGAERARRRLGISRPILLLSSDKIASPVIWCWAKRPALLLPTNATDSNRTCDWAALFCHELAHLRRLDHVTGLLAELLVCILPWHPLMWLGKKRLLALSEHACDDWALANADCNAGYARSLLDLVPQSHPAFAPTILPNRRHLAARIRRILDGSRSNPATGRRWALLAGLVAVCLTVTISFAQPRPADDRDIDRAEHRERDQLERREREEAEEKDRHADREHRERLEVEEAELREQKTHARELEQHAKRIERELKSLGDGQDDEARRLQAELREIREQMTAMKRELDLRARKTDQHVRELMQHRNQLQHRAEEIELELKEHPDHPERRRLRAALEELEQQMRRIDTELRGPRRDRPPVEAREADPHLRELMQHREQLRVRADQIELELRELGDRNPDRSHQLHGEMTDIAGEIERIERELRGAREAREPRDAEMRNRELMQHRAELLERAEHIERELKELGDSHPDESHELRAQLDRIEAQLGRIDEMLRGRGPRDDAPEMRELMMHRAELQAQAEKIKHDLRGLGDADTDDARALREALERTMHELEQTEKILRSCMEAPGREANKAHLRELMEEREQLHKRAADIEHRLEEIGDSRPDETHELRRQLEEIHERARDIEAQLRGPRREAREPRNREARIRELLGRRAEFEAHARETRILIDRLDNEEDKAAEHRTLEDIHRQMEEIDREFEAIEHLDRRERPSREHEPGNIEQQVDRLRGEMNELRGQMNEIRYLLEQLLERRRTDRPRDEGEF